VILVTGGAGFIGSSLVDRLLAAGETVAVLDNFDPFYAPEIKRRNLAAARRSPRFTLVEGDIREADVLERAFSDLRPERVVHLAARAGVRPSIQNPSGYADVNVTGTARVLEASQRHGVRRFLFGSSSSVYGESRQVPFREEMRVDHPVSPYAATKKAGEELAYAFHHLHGLPVCCLRFFTVYGPRQRPEMAIHKFTRLIDSGQEVPVFGAGDTSRDYTYIDDILDGIVAALERPLPGWSVYNLGESASTRLDALVDLIGRALDRKPRLKMLPAQPGDVPVTFADLTLARRDLGYNPRVPVSEGIPRFVEWYRAEAGTMREAGA
jgi:UDP-glucuronate 4-epimerase